MSGSSVILLMVSYRDQGGFITALAGRLPISRVGSVVETGFPLTAFVLLVSGARRSV